MDSKTKCDKIHPEVHRHNTVMIVDDEPSFLNFMEATLKHAGISHILTIQDSRHVLPLLNSSEVAVIILDLLMPYLSGSELLLKINQEFPEIPVVVLTAVDKIETAVECMKAGAFDYLVKPVDKSRLITCIKRTLEMYELRHETFSLKKHLLTDEIENESAFSSIVTRSRKMRAIFHYVESISKSIQPVLITGETGVGKELFARAIHDTSTRCNGPFVALNVAGLDDNVFSDTLFGHKKGAFTGADSSRDGIIASASNGTLFLDEIGDLSEASQIKLLRLLQEQEYLPLGSDVIRRCNTRIIVATNKNIERLLETGKFRNDLYYRLRTHHIHIPPLRERLEDIPLLLNHFLEESSRNLKKKKPSFPPELLTLLSTYHFPGNVRELRAMVFDAVTRHGSRMLSMECFIDAIGKPDTLPQHTAIKAENPPFFFDISQHFPTLKEAEELLISEALKRSNGNQRIAATLLGISRQALNKRLSRKKIFPSEGHPESD
jgi:DNA-binding NtrC family response regulator